MASATCEVREGADGSFVGTTNGVDVGIESEITIRLASGEGVRNWTIECIGTDELGSVDEINDALSVDSSARTATFDAPAVEGRALLFRSTIYRHNGTSTAETFGIFIPMSSGRRVGALNQTYEGNATHGWVTTVNDLIRNGAYGDLSVIRQDTATTEDATPTTIAFDYTGITDIPDDCVVAVTATVLGRDKDDGSKFLRLELARSMAVVAGTGTFNGSTREFDAERVSMPATTATIGRDAGTLRPYVEVTGIAARNIDWKAVLQYDTLLPLDGIVVPPSPYDFYAEAWEYLIEGDNLVADSHVTGTASGGGSAGRDWVSTTSSGLAAGVAFGAHDSIQWDSHAAWTSGEIIVSDAVNPQDWTLVLVADLQTFAATGTDYYSCKQILGHGSPYFGIGIAEVAGQNKVLAGVNDGSARVVVGPAPVGKRVIIWRCIAGVQDITVDGTTFAGDSVTAIADRSTHLRNDEWAGMADLDVALLAIRPTGCDNTELADIDAFMRTRFSIP